MFYQGLPICNCTHVPGPLSKSNSESDYNVVCTAGMDIAYFRMINNELFNKDIDVITEQAPLIILYIKSYICIDNNVKDTKHTRHIFKIMHFVKNNEELSLHKIVWYDGVLQLEDIGTKNVKEYGFNTRLGYAMVRLDN